MADHQTRGTVHIHPAQLFDALTGDPEFVLTTRFLTARVQVRVGDQVLNLRFVDGVLSSLDERDTGFTSYEVLVAAEESVWSEILRPVPRPFYQDLWSAKFYHGLRIEGNMDLMSAYYPALSRLCSVMRTLHHQEVQS